MSSIQSKPVTRTIMQNGERMTLEVNPGRMWMARDDDHKDLLLVLITGFTPDRTYCTAIPLSNGSCGMRGTLHVDVHDITIPPFIAWPRLHVTIPLRFLFHYMTDVPLNATKAISLDRVAPQYGVTRLAATVDDEWHNAVKKYRRIRSTVHRWRSMSEEESQNR